MASNEREHRQKTAKAFARTKERLCSDCARLLTLVLPFLIIASAALPTSCSSQAFADEQLQENGVEQPQKSLTEQVHDLKSTIESAKAEYLSATQQKESFDSRMTQLQADIAYVTEQIDSKRKKLSELLVTEYKEPSLSAFVESIMEAGSIDEAVKRMDYANRIAGEQARMIKEIDELKKSLANDMDEMEAKKIEASLMAENAIEAERAWSNKLDEIKPKVKELREEHLSKASEASGSEQLEAALDYLECVDGATEQQLALLRAAYNTPYAGTNYCERWMSNVYRNAGYSYGSYGSAAENAKANCSSYDLESIPVGALVFGSGSGYMGSRYGHVGICVASGTGNSDALILDNEGSRTKKAVPLSEWTKWQTALCWIYPERGAFGWGFPSSVSGIDAIAN